MYVLILFLVSLGWVGGIQFLLLLSSSLPALLLLPSLFFLLFALVLLVLLLVLLLLHSLCLGSHRFHLLSFARSLLSSPIVFSPPSFAKRCPSPPEVFFLSFPFSPLAFPRGAYGKRLPPDSTVCSNPSLTPSYESNYSVWWPSIASRYFPGWKNKSFCCPKLTFIKVDY